MTQLQRNFKKPTSGSYTREELRMKNLQGRPRDGLRSAYGGDENKGPAAHKKTKKEAGTKVKGRRTEKSSGRTPVV